MTRKASNWFYRSTVLVREWRGGRVTTHHWQVNASVIGHVQQQAIVVKSRYVGLTGQKMEMLEQAKHCGGLHAATYGRKPSLVE